MQTLGLSDSTPRSEGRLKALLWPTIRNEGDFDHVTRQGFWVCQVVAAASLVALGLGGAWLPGLLSWLFYFLAGVGVRERSRTAAIAAFGIYFFESMLSGLGIVRIIFLALLLANVRGNWLASRWQPEADDWHPVRMQETLVDRFVDQWPPRVWRWGRYLFYVLLALMVFGVATIAFSGIGGRVGRD